MASQCCVIDVAPLLRELIVSIVAAGVLYGSTPEDRAPFRLLVDLLRVIPSDRWPSRCRRTRALVGSQTWWPQTSTCPTRFPTWPEQTARAPAPLSGPHSLIQGCNVSALDDDFRAAASVLDAGDELSLRQQRLPEPADRRVGH